jgi:hypothetical protein
MTSSSSVAFERRCSTVSKGRYDQAVLIGRKAVKMCSSERSKTCCQIIPNLLTSFSLFFFKYNDRCRCCEFAE